MTIYNKVLVLSEAAEIVVTILQSNT